MLLVLDNFEHVLEAGAWLADLLAVAPNVRVLTTSRSVLRLYGEHEFPVPTLSVPGPNTPRDPEALSQYHAVTLFIQRAEAVKPEFTVTNDTAPTIAEICYQLDGLPLAIELAAARVRLFPPRSLLDRLTSRLELLTGGGRDLPARHQTLRAAIDWSYSLLDTAEQALFVRLSVFHGGGSLDAVEAICCSGSSLGSDILDGITSLTEKSLLRLEGEEEPRFVMLATIREYAAERLTESGDGERLRRRHAQYYLDLARRAEREFHGPEEKVWLDRIQVEVDNLRAVVQWVKNTGTLEVGQQLVESLYHFWRMRGYLSEVSRWLDGMLRRENIATGMGLTEARLHFLAGMIALDQADWERAAPHFEDALTLFRECDDPQGTAWAGYWVGRIGLWMSNCEPARRLLDESLALVNQHGATWEPRARSVRLYALLGLFEIAHSEHDLERASALYEEAVQFAGNPDEQGSKLGMADQLRVLGHFQREQGNLQSSVSLLEESQTLFQQVGATYESLDNLRSLGWIAQEQGNLERATALYETSLALSRQLGDGRGTAIALLGLADVARNRGDAARVIELCGEALKLSREHRNDPFMSAFSGFALNNLGLAERTLGDFDRARSLLEESRTVLQGAAHQHLTSEPIIGLGWVALDEQEYGRAREFFVESLRLLRGGALSWQVAAGLEGMATVAMAQDKAHTATYMLSTADAIRTQLGMPIWPVNRQRYERVLVAARESLGTDEFDRAWEEGRRMALEEVIEHAVNEAPMW